MGKDKADDKDRNAMLKMCTDFLRKHFCDAKFGEYK